MYFECIFYSQIDVKVPQGQVCTIAVIATTNIERDDHKCLDQRKFPQIVIGYGREVNGSSKVDCGIIVTEENWTQNFKLTLSVRIG